MNYDAVLYNMPVVIGCQPNNGVTYEGIAHDSVNEAILRICLIKLAWEIPRCRESLRWRNGVLLMAGPYS